MGRQEDRHRNRQIRRQVVKRKITRRNRSRIVVGRSPVVIQAIDCYLKTKSQGFCPCYGAHIRNFAREMECTEWEAMQWLSWQYNIADAQSG
jgi:predicted nucleic-acid-binding protein